MMSRRFQKIICLFSLLAFLGSLVPCQCLADVSSESSSKTGSDQNHSHNCCTSNNSDSERDSENPWQEDKNSCSYCTICLEASTVQMSDSLSSSSRGSEIQPLLAPDFSRALQISHTRFISRGRPPGTAVLSASSASLNVRLCRWLI